MFSRAYKVSTHTPGSSHWKNYTLEEHQYNVRAFARYLTVDKQVIEASSVYNNLPQDLKVRKSRSRKAPTVFTTTSDDSPRKKRFVVKLDTSSDEDNSSQNEDDGGDEE